MNFKLQVHLIRYDIIYYTEYDNGTNKHRALESNYLDHINNISYFCTWNPINEQNFIGFYNHDIRYFNDRVKYMNLM